jgi:hypothetical protein
MYRSMERDRKNTGGGWPVDGGRPPNRKRTPPIEIKLLKKSCE